MMNPIRFGGIASGLDTESLVKQLVSAERLKVDRFSQQKIWETWRQEAFNRTNKTMANFIVDSRKKLELTRVTSTGSLMANSYQNMSWVNKATSSNEGAFNVSATASASPGTYEMRVDRLASGVTLASAGDLTKHNSEPGVPANVGELLNFEGEEITKNIQINGKIIELNKTDTLTQVATKIRNETGLNARFDAGSKRFFLSTTETGNNAEIRFGNDGDVDNQPDSQDLNAEQLEALNQSTADFLGAIKFDSVIKQEPVDISKPDGEKKYVFENQNFQGKTAKIKFQGAEIEYDSNNINILGMSINLTSTTSDFERITVSTDIDGAVDKIKEFVEEYNNIVEMMNLSLSEKQYRDFKPLTDEQRKAMGEDEVKLWDEKAKSGLLRGDQTLSRVLQTMRSGLYQEVYDKDTNDFSAEGTKIGALYEFGITTGNYRDGGKLVIDEDKLRTALRDEPDRVIKTLFKSSTIPEATGGEQKDIDQNKARRADTGVFSRLYDDMISGMKSIIDQSGPGNEATLLRSVRSNIMMDYVTKGSISLIDKRVGDIDKRIDRENIRISGLEERYWRQFTALEKAMDKMNNQSAWLAQQFSSN